MKQSIVTTNCDKTAEVIVLRNCEGTNNLKFQFDLYVQVLAWQI